MKKHRGISPDTLKYIALASMLIDHIAAGLFRFFSSPVYTNNPMLYRLLDNLRQLMNYVGRLAFPIFAYQLVQGFIFTKSRIKYALNLLVFAIISELPFDLYFYGKTLYFRHQNVMFEMLLGLLLLSVLELINDKLFNIDFARDSDVWCDTDSSALAKAVAVDAVIAILFLIPAQLLHFDYGGKGIVLFTSIYILYKNREIMSTVCPVLFIASFFPVNLLLNHASPDAALKSVINEIPSCFSFFLIYFDNGIRKIKGKRKYIFYAFYPLHIIILFLIRYIISISSIIRYMVH